MKKLITAFTLILTFPLAAAAQNTPCSGKKGGISHCDGAKFVCNDGSYSKSKSICSGYGKENDADTNISDNLDIEATDTKDIKKKQK